MLRSSLAISNQGRFFANRLVCKSKEFSNRFFFANSLFFYSTCVISSFIFPCTFLLVACESETVFCMSSANIFSTYTTLFRNWLECGRRLFYAFRYRVFANISFSFLTAIAKITAAKYLLSRTKYNNYILWHLFIIYFLLKTFFICKNDMSRYL